MLLFHPGLLICLVLLSLAWPLGLVPAIACAAVLIAGYAYLLLSPLRTSSSAGRPRRLATTVALLGSLVVATAVFLLLMERWDARWPVRWPLAFMAAYYAGAIASLLWRGSGPARLGRTDTAG